MIIPYSTVNKSCVSKAMLIVRPATLHPAISSCKAIAMTSMRHDKDFLAVRAHQLVPTGCRGIRNCLGREVEAMMEPGGCAGGACCCCRA